MSVNYDRVCRLCLSSRGELLPIFPTTSSDDSEPPAIASKIKDCVSVQINEDDDLPSNVCKKCMDNVNNWHIFKAVCERTQNKLQSLIKNDGSQLEEVQIKSEPLSDEAYDDGVVIDGSYPDLENASTSNKVQPEGPPILASLGLTPRSDKNYIDPRMDWHRVHAILDIIQDDEVIDSLQSTEECDVLHHSDHDSDSETELMFDVNEKYFDSKNGYICKNEEIISKNPLLSTTNNNVKVREVLKLRKRHEVTQKHCPLPRNAWELLFTDDLLELIVTSTNEKIANCKKGGYAAATNMNELKSLIGILYFHGIMRPTNQKCSDLWHDEFGILCIQNAMKLDRFKFLLRNLSFDHGDSSDNIMQFDVMKRIRKAFEIFALNCRTAYDIESVAVIDEVLLPVYGPCPFRYNIKKKPLKCGIKIVLLVDSSNFYISNMDVITDPYFSASDIVNKLVQHLAGSGRTIIMDSWYTSLTLMDRLQKEYKLFSIAALNPTDDIVPPLFLSNYRKSQTFVSGFLNDNVSLTSYVNTSQKSINILSNDPMFYKKGHVNHQTVVSVYKKNQPSVELIDVLMHYYTTMQNTNDWTLSLFFMLLNIAAVNAQVIWVSQNSENIVQRRLFIKDLAVSLLESNEEIPCVLDGRAKKKKLMFLDHLTPSYKGRRRCRICVKTMKRDRRTRQYCVRCGQFICREHTTPVCTMCE